MENQRLDSDIPKWSTLLVEARFACLLLASVVMKMQMRNKHLPASYIVNGHNLRKNAKVLIDKDPGIRFPS